MTVQELQQRRKALHKAIATSTGNHEALKQQISQDRLTVIEFLDTVQDQAAGLTAMVLLNVATGFCGSLALQGAYRMQLELIEKELESRMASSTN